MAEELETKVKIGGDTAGLSAAFTEAAAKVREGAAGITESFSGVGEVLEGISGKLVVLSAGLAGVAGFSEIIGSTKRLTGEINGLAKSMGTSVEEASVLHSALAGIGADSETFTGALDHLARQISKNESGINALGIATRNTDGTMRDGKDVMLEALRVVQEYKPGLDQTQAAMYLFGRSVSEVRQLMPLLNVNMEEAKEKAQALGLVLTGEQVAAMRGYKIAMNEGKEVIEATFNAIGQRLIPVLTKSAGTFAEMGPKIVEVATVLGQGLAAGLELVAKIFADVADVARSCWSIITEGAQQISGLIQTSGVDVAGWGETWRNVEAIFKALAVTLKGDLVAAILVVVDAVKTIIISFQTAGTVIGDVIGAAVKIFDDVKSGNWGDVFKDITDGLKVTATDVVAGYTKIYDTQKETFQKLVENAKQTGLDASAALLSGYAQGANATPKEAPKPTPKGTKAFEAPELAKDLGGRDQVLQAQLAGEVAIVKEYSGDAQRELERGYKDNLVSLRDYYEKRLELAQSEIDHEIDANERLLATAAARTKAAQDNPSKNDKEVNAALTAQIQLETKLTLLREKRAEVTRESAAAEAEAEKKVAKEIEDARLKAEERAALDAADQADAIIKANAKANIINAEQELEALRQLNAQKLAIQTEYAQKRAALEDQTVQNQIKLNDQLLTLNADYQKKDTALVEQYSAQRRDLETTVLQDVSTAFQASLDGIMTGHQTLLKAIESFIGSLQQQFQKLASQEIASMLFGGNGSGSGRGKGNGGQGLLGGLVGSLFGGGSGGGAGGLLSGIFGGGGAGGDFGGLVSGADNLGSLALPAATDSGAAAVLSAIPAFATGADYIATTGLAQLHAGEAVLTAAQNKERLATGSLGGGQRVTNVFNIPQGTDMQSQSQIAAAASLGLRRAKRNT
jgi:hypothetical protein